MRFCFKGMWLWPILILSVSAQQTDPLQQLEQLYRSFDYEAVILQAEALLENRQELRQEELLQIYTVKAISHYSLGEQDLARESFIEALKIDRTLELDPARISPKIITFFSQVKSDFIQILGDTQPPEDEPPAVSADSVVTTPQQPAVDSLFFDSSFYAGSVAKTLIIPGWGHLEAGQTVKGIVLGTASLSLLTASVMYIISTNNAEKDYLGESDPARIESRYESYNDNYRMRNLVIAAYLAIWAYSQLDVLFFSSGDFKLQMQPRLQLTRDRNIEPHLQLGFRLNF